MGIITTAAINVNKLFQVCPDTNEDVPEKKSLIAPTHGISDDATPTTQVSLTAVTGLPNSSFKPRLWIYESSAVELVALS